MPNGSETIKIHPYPGKLSNGDPKPDLPLVEVKSCIIWPRTTVDPEKGEIIISGLNVYVQPGSRIPTAKDEVTARGVRYGVEGEPGVYVKGSGEGKGATVVLKKLGT